MTKPIKHHYQPKVLLKNFADENNKLYSCRVQDLTKTFYSTIDDLFTQRHLHTIKWDDGTPDFSAEHDLSAIESRTGEIFLKVFDIVRNGAPRLDLTAAERATLIECIASLGTRDPKHFGELNQDSELDRKIEQMINTDDIDPARIGQLKHNIRARAISLPPEMLPTELSMRGMVVLRLAEHVPPLIVGNQMLIVDQAHSSPVSWMAIASDIAVYFVGEPGEIIVKDVVSDFQARKMNCAIAERSNQIAGRRRDDVVRLAKLLTSVPRGLQ